MAAVVSKVGWKLCGVGAGLLAASVTKKVVRAGWTRAKGGDPPADPKSPDTAWTEALGWAVASAVAVTVARLLAQRGAAGAWQKATGSPPPGVGQPA